MTMIQFFSFSLYNNFSLQGSFWILDGQGNDADIKVFSLKIIIKDEKSNILGVKVIIAIMLQLNLDRGGIDMQITPPAYLVRKHFWI